MTQICKSALLTMSALETRQAKPRRDFLNNGNDGPQKGEDPLKEFRNMLKAGTVMTEWSNVSPVPSPRRRRCRVVKLTSPPP